MPGARELLGALRAARRPDGAVLQLAAARSSTRRCAEPGSTATFAATVAGDDGHAPKPAPDPYLAAAAALGADPARLHRARGLADRRAVARAPPGCT